MTSIDNLQPQPYHAFQGKHQVTEEGEDEDIPTILLTPEQAIQRLDLQWHFKKADESCSAASTGKPVDDQNSNSFTVEEVNSESEAFQIVKCEEDVDASSPAASASGSHSSPRKKKRQRAALLSASVFKESQETKLGMGIHRVGGHLQVCSMKTEPGFLLSESPFQVGDRLVRINNQSCKEMRTNDISALLKSTTGMLTIVVENPMGDPSLVESMIAKASPDSKTGLVITSNVSAERDRIKVSRVDPNSLFSESLLNRRDTILSIDDNQMENLDVMEAAQIIVKAKRTVTVAAERQAESAIVVSL